MMQQIDQIKVCAPRPERCEGLVMATVPGQHEYEWYCNGRTITLGRDIQSVNLYQEGEGSFAYAVAKGAIVVEPGDGISVHEYNHGSFNISYFVSGHLQSQLTYVEERGGLTMLVNQIKRDAKFPDSIREIGDELLVNAIANQQPNQPLTFKGLNFQESFERWVVSWQRAPYTAAKNHWRQFTSKDFVRMNNKILCTGGAAELSRYWKQDILARAAQKREDGFIDEAIAMELIAQNIYVCPNPRYSNALGMLELDPITSGTTIAVDFGYSAVKRARQGGGVALLHSAIALPLSKINLRDIKEGSAYIRLKSGPLYDHLRKRGQPTEFIFGSAAESTPGAEKIINGAKELYIPHAVLAALGSDINESVPAKKATKVTLAT